MKPIIIAINNSYKYLSHANDSNTKLIPLPLTIEYLDKLISDIPLFQITTNTFVIASVITLVKVAISFLAAFAIVFYQFKFKKVTYMVLVATIFVPFTVTMVPNYIIMARLGFVD